MRQLSDAEMLSLRELLQMEVNSLSTGQAIQALITDPDLKSQAQSSVLATEGRIKSIQQFIFENKVVNPGEVH